MFLIQEVRQIDLLDELYYNSETLHIVKTHNDWLLTDGEIRMHLLDTKEDARNALRVARRYKYLGFIGRDNNRRNRYDYITEYWVGNSGLPYEPLTNTHSTQYNPSEVIALNKDHKGWQIKSPRLNLTMADNIKDALLALRLIQRYTRMCLIGGKNTRPNKKKYIMRYWE